MASDPLQMLVAQGGSNPYLAQMQGQQGLQAGQQQLQIGALQLKAAQDQQQQAQAYQADVVHYFNNPKPEILAGLIAKYPQQADALKQSKAALDEPARQSQLTQYGQLYNAANAGRTDLLVKQATALKTAEAAQGIDTSEIDDVLGRLQSSDPVAQKEATKQIQALSQVHIAALDPKFAEDLQKLKPEGFTLGQGQQRYDANGNVIASVAPKPDYLVVPEGGKAVPLNGAPALDMGGGGQASGATGGSSSSTANAPRRSMGWTPRARDGGDNSDAVVDSKIANISKATGFDPDAPLTPQQAAKVIAAIPATEGGPGSLAAKNNNPGNIKWGGFARSQGAIKDPNSGYAVFPSAEAGMQAAQRLGQGYYARGQRTIRDIIEGKPVGGSTPGARPNGDPAGTIYGTPKRGYQMLTPAENEANGLDPNVRYQRGPDGQITALGGQSKAQLKPIPQPAVKIIVEDRGTLRQIDHAIAMLGGDPDLGIKADDHAHADAIGWGTGTLGDWYTNNIGDPAGVETRAAIGKIAGQIIHDVSGAAVTLSEEPRFRPYVPSLKDNAATALKKLRNLRQLAASSLDDYQSQYSEDQGYRPFGGAGGKPAVPAPAPSGFKILSVRPK